MGKEWVLGEGRKPYQFDIRDRVFDFALRIVKMVRHLESRESRFYDSTKVVVRQLLRSATSVGANLEEAKGAESRADFLHKLRISLKESRETHYWLRLIAAAEIVKEENIKDLIDESDQIIRIITSITVNAQNRE